jgi:hypothetical protein
MMLLTASWWAGDFSSTQRVSEGLGCPLAAAPATEPVEADELVAVAEPVEASPLRGIIIGSGEGEGGSAACAVAVANRGGSGSTWQEVAINSNTINATQKQTDLNGIGPL